MEMFSDYSRMEIRVDGIGSIFAVGVHFELHWWHNRNHFPKPIVIRHTQIASPRTKRNHYTA